jgi:hypothetical protein
MEKIVGQAEAQRRQDEARAERQQTMGKIKTVAGALVVAAVIGFAVTHLSELQGVVDAQLAKTHKSGLMDSVTGGKVDALQQAADKQNAEISEITDTTANSSGNKFAKIEQAAEKRDAILNEITK